ncbi:hypothetical protein [Haladaptatus litoreus]|uniref:hypothetical protein n=1 Tax=Haladaptatus litoreus TaxID=553468 RepID=UPI001FE3CCBD|nr:hypothetical protein [Haladaptatus litoreus]
MNDDPKVVTDALEEAHRSFERGGTPEEGLSELTEEEAQLKKACRLIAAAQTLQDQNGYHTAVVELALGQSNVHSSFMLSR